MSDRDTREEIKEPDFVLVNTGVPDPIEVVDSDAIRHSWSLGSMSVHKKLYTGVFILVVGIIGAAAWMQGSNEQAFPNLPPGSYIGKIEGVFGSGPDSSSLYIERMESPDELLFVVFKEGWPPTAVPAATLRGENSSDFVWPLLLKSDMETLKLTGRLDKDGVFGGTAEITGGGKRGSWRVSAVGEGHDVLADMEESQEVMRWLSAKADLEIVKSLISHASKKALSQSEEIGKLNKYLSDGDLLRAKAGEKFEKAKAELEAAKAELEAKRSQVRKLSNQVKLSGRVTASGKLVSLSRESLERENRWVESMFRTYSKSGSPGISREFARAKEVMELRKKISFSKDKIYNLQREIEALKSSR